MALSPIGAACSSRYRAAHRRSRPGVDSTMSCGLCALIQTRVRCGPHGVSSASEWNVLHVEMTTDCMGRGVTPLLCQDPQVATELKERTCVRDEAVCKNRTRNTVTFGEHPTPILHSTICFARVRVFRPRKAHRSPASHAVKIRLHRRAHAITSVSSSHDEQTESIRHTT